MWTFIHSNSFLLLLVSLLLTPIENELIWCNWLINCNCINEIWLILETQARRIYIYCHWAQRQSQMRNCHYLSKTLFTLLVNHLIEYSFALLKRNMWICAQKRLVGFVIWLKAIAINWIRFEYIYSVLNYSGKLIDFCLAFRKMKKNTYVFGIWSSALSQASWNCNEINERKRKIN